MRGIRAIAVLLLATATLAVSAASAVEIERLPGLWSFSEGGANSGAPHKIGTLLARDDLEYEFVFLECSRTSAVGFIYLNPKIVGKLVADDRYTALRLRRADTTILLQLEAIQLMDAGPHAWAVKVQMGREAFEQLSQAGTAAVEIGHDDTGRGFVAAGIYELPSENRQKAAANFLKACFGS